MNDRLVVMKFGGASLASKQRIEQVADIIAQKQKSIAHILVVVSAMGGMTENLLSLAREIHDDPPRRELDMLVSVGERVSMALLAMALSKRKVQAVSFTGSQSGIITCSRHNDARIIDVRPSRIKEALCKDQVVIVAGFQGVSREKEITTLGRGGSDTTAVALGVALDAECVEYFKDVAGVYPEDPKKNPLVKPFSHLDYEEAEEIVAKGAKVLHARALSLARRNHLPLIVRSFLQKTGDEGTKIGDGKKRLLPVFEEEVLVVGNPVAR